MIAIQFLASSLVRKYPKLLRQTWALTGNAQSASETARGIDLPETKSAEKEEKKSGGKKKKWALMGREYSQHQK